MFSAIFFLNPRLRPILLLDRVAVITVSNSTISFSSQARQCHDGQLCDKRRISLHTINSRSKEDQQHDHLPPTITILTSDPPQTTRYLPIYSSMLENPKLHCRRHLLMIEISIRVSRSAAVLMYVVVSLCFIHYGSLLHFFFEERCLSKG